MISKCECKHNLALFRYNITVLVLSEVKPNDFDDICVPCDVDVSNIGTSNLKALW